MATIRVKRGTAAATLLYGEIAASTTDLYFGNSSGNAIRLAKASEIPTVNNATLTMNVSGSGLSGSDTFTANQSSATTFTVTSNATTAGTASTIAYRDASGGLTAGTDGFKTGSFQLKYNATTDSIDFIFS